MNANTSMICLYWNIGRAILEKQEKEGWGVKVIDRVSKDLKTAFPEMSGFSPRNIKYMRKFAQCWLDYEIVQRVVAQIPWRTNITLMDSLSGYQNPIGVAEWQNQLTQSLPEELQSSLPSIEEIEAVKNLVSMGKNLS